MNPRQRKHAEAILRSHEERAITESKLNVGAKRTVVAIRKAGISIGVLTRNTRENVLAIAEKHGLNFDSIVDRDDGPVKPEAFGVLELCRRFKVKPQETLVVGDYLFDLLCARAAGANSVLLANHNKADEFAEHADFVIENIGQVLEIIEQKNSV
jgi:HAD superfamily hydrolase (TIGR01509 family)